VVPEISSRKLQPRRVSSWKICRARRGRPANPSGTKSHRNCRGTSRSLDLVIQLFIDTCVPSEKSANWVNGFLTYKKTALFMG